jgi:predicted RNase H-like nuclease (RuvC/YqgF family)
MEKMIENWELLVGAVGSIIAFFSGRGMKKAQEKQAVSNADALHLENLDKIFAIQKKQIDELVNDFEAEKKRLKLVMKETVDDLQTILTQKQKIIGEQEKIIKKQNDHISELRKMVKNMESFINRHKKKCPEFLDFKINK